MKLSTLGPKEGSRKAYKRVGRGNASGNGRTAGRGEKGQKARSGASIRAGFEGGQMPLYRRIPKIGFRSRKQIMGLNQFMTISTDWLEKIIEDGTEVNAEFLKANGFKCGAKQQAGFKILAGRDPISKKITVKVEAITAGARKLIEDAGGSVELVPTKRVNFQGAEEAKAE